MNQTINTNFGKCEQCGGQLKPVYFKEFEETVEYGIRHKTGRWRRAASHLTCDTCLQNHCVDDSFDGPWHRD